MHAETVKLFRGWVAIAKDTWGMHKFTKRANFDRATVGREIRANVYLKGFKIDAII